MSIHRSHPNSAETSDHAWLRAFLRRRQRPGRCSAPTATNGADDYREPVNTGPIDAAQQIRCHSFPLWSHEFRCLTMYLNPVDKTYPSNSCSCRPSHRSDRRDRLGTDRFWAAAAAATSLRVAPAASAARTSRAVSSPRRPATEIRINSCRRRCAWPSDESPFYHITYHDAVPPAGVFRIRSAARSSNTSICSRSASAASATSVRRSSMGVDIARRRGTLSPMSDMDL